MKHRLYIDEVGNHDWRNSDDPNNRYLSLTGVLVSLDHVKDVIHPAIEQIKNTFFINHPDTPTVFHRKEIVNGDPPFESLKDKIARDAFNAEILDGLTTWRYKVFTVCIDKKAHRDGYDDKWHCYHYCFEVLVEKCVKYLNNKGLIADVMIEGRNKKADQELEASFTNLYDNGNWYLKAPAFQKALTSRQLKVKPKSANIVGLQLADLIAHPSRNEILRDNGVDINVAPFAEQIIGILATKYDGYGGNIYGKKFLYKE